MLKKSDFTVFYDEDAKAEMWGEDLTEFFTQVYEHRARFALMFISKHYAAKAWTRLERRSVLQRALEQSSSYLLPVRIDSTSLPGVRESIGFLEAHVEGPAGIAQAVAQKLGAPVEFSSLFNGRAPRAATELAIVLGERPAGWEYLAFSYWLASGVEARSSKYNDHRMKFALGSVFHETGELTSYLQAELARISGVMETFEELLLGPAQTHAMGEPGEPGEPELIEYLAERMMAIYEELLDWSYRLRAATTSTDEGRAAFRALADYANQPVQAIRDFVQDFQKRMDSLSASLESGENISMELTIAFDVPADVAARYSESHEGLRKVLLR